MTRPGGPRRPLGQRRPQPEGARGVDRTRTGWEGRKWNWPDPAWSSVLRPSLWGHLEPGGIWSLKSHPAWEQGDRGLGAHWTFF